MYCTNCGTTTEENAAFCPNCGTNLPTGSANAKQASNPAFDAFTRSTPGVSSANTGLPTVTPEPTGKRALAYLIDVVPILFLALIHFLPIFGWMLYGLLHVLYWLLRDINGASLGKSVMGSFVANENGGPSTTQQRILRNVPLAIPGLFGMIPLIGIVFEFFIALFVFGGEALLVLATGRRLGDRLAGTTVLSNRPPIKTYY